jgi:hypothetical protein
VTAVPGRLSSSAPKKAFGEAWFLQTAPRDGACLLNGHVLVKNMSTKYDLLIPWAIGPIARSKERKKRVVIFGRYMVAYACHGVWLPAVHLFYFDCFIFLLLVFVLRLPENWVCCHASKEIMLFTLQCMSCNLVFWRMRRKKKRPLLKLRILMNYLNPVLILPL